MGKVVKWDGFIRKTSHVAHLPQHPYPTRPGHWGSSSAGRSVGDNPSWATHTPRGVVSWVVSGRWGVRSCYLGPAHGRPVTPDYLLTDTWRSPRAADRGTCSALNPPSPPVSCSSRPSLPSPAVMVIFSLRAPGSRLEVGVQWHLVKNAGSRRFQDCYMYYDWATLNELLGWRVDFRFWENWPKRPGHHFCLPHVGKCPLHHLPIWSSEQLVQVGTQQLTQRELHADPT